MIALLQRVSEASVRVDGVVVGSIARVLLVFLGVGKGDAEAEVDRLAHRVAGYRCFPSEDGVRQMDASVQDIGGSILVVSQFTLLADTKKGMRPGFDPAALPEDAEPLYDRFSARLIEEGVGEVTTGRFGARMQVALVNEGPVTLILEKRPAT